MLKKYQDKSDAIQILQDVQKKFGYISKDNLKQISKSISVPYAKLYSIVTFYKSFSLKPKGKFVIRICDGTACHIKGSQALLAEIKNTLGIIPGETTSDGKFSLETVACMGVCALAPVMVIGENYYGNLNRVKLKTIINEYITEEHK